MGGRSPWLIASQYTLARRVAAFHRKCDMTQDFEESARNFLSLLNKLPSTPSITFRGFVDTSVTQARTSSPRHDGDLA